MDKAYFNLDLVSNIKEWELQDFLNTYTDNNARNIRKPYTDPSPTVIQCTFSMSLSKAKILGLNNILDYVPKKVHINAIKSKFDEYHNFSTIMYTQYYCIY